MFASVLLKKIVPYVTYDKLRLNAVYLNLRAEQLFANPEQYSSVTGLRGAFVTHEINIFIFTFIGEFLKFAQGGGITHYLFSKPLFIVYFFKRFVVRLGGIPAALLLKFFEKLIRRRKLIVPPVVSDIDQLAFRN